MTATENGSAPVRIRAERGREEQLRDYFLRLGATAAIDEGGAVSVCLEETDDQTVEEYLTNWTSVNRLTATVELEPAPKPPAVPIPTVQSRPRLGEVLVGRGLVTEDQVTEALAEAAETGDRLGRVLLQHRWLFEDELARALSEQLQIPYVNIRTCGVDRSVARAVPVEIGIRYVAIPIGFVNGRVRIAFGDPCDEAACAAIAGYLNDYEPVVAEMSDIVIAWRSLA